MRAATVAARLTEDPEVAGRIEAVFKSAGLSCDECELVLEEVGKYVERQLGRGEQVGVEGLLAAVGASVDVLTDTTNGPIAVVTTFADVERSTVRWLWRDRIPFAMPTLFEGDPGVGKSTVLLDIAARLTRGAPMPDGTGGGDPRDVLLLSAEDDPGAVIRARLEAAGADLSRVHTLHMRAAEGDRETVISAADTREWERIILAKAVGLVIVDPVVAYLPDGTDTNSDHSVRRALGKLKPIAERTGCAVVAVRHWKKAPTENAIHRGGGSIGFVGAARSVLAIGRDPEDETRRVVAVVKTNLAPIAPSLAFRLAPVDDTTRVEWIGPVDVTADSMTAAPGTREERTALGEAKEFLRERLEGGPVRVDAIRADARQQDIAWMTVRRAKESLGVCWKKTGFGPGSYGTWALPSPEVYRMPEDGGAE